MQTPGRSAGRITFADVATLWRVVRQPELAFGDAYSAGRLEIDGEEVGVTPMAGVLLTPGDHEFRARMPDGTVLEETIRIAPDNRHIAFSQ